MAITTKSRALGAIWGTCVADALGGPVQFKEPSTFPRITDLAYIANRKKPAGCVDHLSLFTSITNSGYSSFSDDGSMTLALAQSFIDSQGKYNHALAIKFFVQWKYQGRFSSSTSAWDVGGSTRKALAVWKDDGWKDVERTQRAITQKLDKESCSGNGSLMRISPIGVALWKDPDAAVLTARQHSLPTHPALACVEACAAFTQLISHAMRGMSFP